MSSLAANFLSLANGEAVDVRDVSALPIDEFREYLVDALSQGLRLSALFGRPVNDRRLQLWAVLADDSRSLLVPLSTETNGSYPSLTPQCPQAHWFEREIFEQYGVRPTDHPWLKPIRFQAPHRGSSNAGTSGEAWQIGVTDFFQMAGEEIHEVAVGRCMPALSSRGTSDFSAMVKWCCTWRSPSATSIGASSPAWWEGLTGAPFTPWRLLPAIPPLGMPRPTAR